MTDREKVINGLEHCSEDGCVGCPYYHDCTMADGFSELAKDVLELLKEQEKMRCKNCQFRDYGENEVDSWDMCKLHRHGTSADDYCSWFVEEDGEAE